VGRQTSEVTRRSGRGHLTSIGGSALLSAPPSGSGLSVKDAVAAGHIELFTYAEAKSEIIEIYIKPGLVSSPNDQPPNFTNKSQKSGSQKSVLSK